MATELTHHIRETPLVDTHEHLKREPAMGIASRIMRDDQYDCFDLAGTRASIRSAA